MSEREAMDAYWERMSSAWIEHEASMEAMFAPVGRALLTALGPRTGEKIIDIGPGTGATMLALAEAVGPEGRVLGVDVAPPMVERASARIADLAHAEAVVADAGSAPIEPGVFDAATSQFGVMFFEDPAASFRVLAENLKPGGRMVFAAWGPRPQNTLFAAADRVAAAHFGALPPADPDAPGPFGLQNATRTLSLMAEAGLDEPRAELVGLTLNAPGPAERFAELQLDIGPAAARLAAEEADDATRAAVHQDLAKAYRTFENGRRLALPAMIFLYSAQRAA